MKAVAEISEVLQAQRKKLGLSQKDMLMRIGMSQQQYQKIESGSDMRLSTLLRILEGMNLELAILTREQAQGIDAVTSAHDDYNTPERDSIWSSVLDDLKDDQ
ncbi:helix-turn-helix domain-containing protein [Marinobacter fonticola]|uniref:helix-turn-helix domain-containing protein n=1 Tax=Marinobacter fonticola TaxID=2603215 RepID=UPI0011E660BF|nr:helix-turn-helix transcriptional regulator [Marinobacter fonticola]